jgi:hypothetical protein
MLRRKTKQENKKQKDCFLKINTLESKGINNSIK